MFMCEFVLIWNKEYFVEVINNTLFRNCKTNTFYSKYTCIKPAILLSDLAANSPQTINMTVKINILGPINHYVNKT